jgi:hypothetical protein
MTQFISASELSIPESVCGPEIVTIGDAWEKVQLQIHAARQMLETNDLQRLPQKNSAILSHLRFMQKGAIMVYGKRRRHIDQGMSVIDSLLADLSAATLGEQVSSVKSRWAELESVVKFIGSQFPEEALLPSATFAHLLPPAVPILHIQMEPVAAILPNRPMRIVFQLVRMKDLKPVGPDDIYRLWINAVPKETGREEFPVNTISLADPNFVPLPPAWHSIATAETTDLRAQLIWAKNEKPAADRPISGTLVVSDTEGRAVNDLEPYMGAYAHIVGISEDLHTVLHAHPDSVKAESEKVGGPDLHFSIRPPRLGFYRLFVQVKRRGKIQSMPFGFRVPE